MTYTKHDRYPDVRDGGSDAETARMVAQLDALGQRFASAPLPATRDAEIARLLRERALASRKPLALARRRGWRGVSRARRIALLAVAALTTIAVLTGATLAFGGPVFPWNYSLLQMFGGAQQGQKVNLASSACGYTLRVRQVYADANVFVMGYAFFRPTGQFVQSGLLAPVVTDANKDTLPLADYGGVANLGGATGTLQYQSFDSSAVSGRPTTLNLHIVIPTIFLINQSPPPSPCVGPESAAQLAADSGLTGAALATETAADAQYAASTLAVRGPFTFDVRVTDHGGRESRAPISVTQHGRTLTLERVISTPLETQFFVSGAAMNAYPTLQVAGRTLDAGEDGPEGNLMVYKFEGSPYRDHGQWTFTIHTMSATPSPQDKQTLPPGTWSFTFTLP